MTESDKALTLLKHIGNELVLLWWQIEAWQALFAVEQEKRRQLIKKTAPGFFTIVQVSLTESILMRISRLMDPAKSLGRSENSSFKHFCETLGNHEQYADLRLSIQALRDDWEIKDPQTKGEAGPYATLKVARNKWLAHSDFTKRSGLGQNQLLMPLTTEDFAVALQLASRLWELYQKSFSALVKADVLEPKHDSLDNRSVMVLKQLSRSLYLDQLMGNDISLHVEGLKAVEEQYVGEDSILPVFGAQDSSRKLR